MISYKKILAENLSALSSDYMRNKTIKIATAATTFSKCYFHIHSSKIIFKLIFRLFQIRKWLHRSWFCCGVWSWCSSSVPHLVHVLRRSWYHCRPSGGCTDNLCVTSRPLIGRPQPAGNWCATIFARETESSDEKENWRHKVLSFEIGELLELGETLWVVGRIYLRVSQFHSDKNCKRAIFRIFYC